MSEFLTRFKANRNWNISVAVLAVISGALYLLDLANGQRSEYYASIAVSMSKSLSNFFFGALDGGGNLTLDKIPGSYWAPAIFVKLFGFSTWSVNAPNALATVGLVVVVAFTARRLLGNTAGIIAGVLIAATPIITAVARSNQPESMFLLMLGLSANRAVAAFQNTSRRSLVASGAWIAAAFQMYMVEAWAVWPALIVAWFFTHQSFLKKVVDLAIAGLVSLGLSAVWIITVWLIPAGSRPYIGGTYHNNPFEMVFGYNALGRFSATQSTASSTVTGLDYRSFTPPFGGTAGLGRMFNQQVAGQISWLIPAVVAALVILLWLKQQRALTIFLGTWFVTFFLMFSLVAGMHQFYVASLAIPMVLLVAMAVASAFKAQKPWLVLVVAAPTVIWSNAMSQLYPGYFAALPYVQAGLLVVACALVLFSSEAAGRHWYRTLTSAVAAAAMVVTPLAWSVDVINHPSSINPAAGPTSLQFGGGGFGGGFGGGMRQGGGFNPSGGTGGPGAGAPGGGLGGFGAQDNSTLIKYLQANRGNAKYLLVTFGAQTAASFTTATGDNILPVGGFDGQDPAPTLAQFKAMVAKGEIKYVMTGGNGGGFGGPGGQSSSGTGSAIQTWVTSNCQIDSNAPGSSTLYVCR
jgi:4-amino-4-deoxy-L-arabinose transferase-like glycosyltransferase